jgi:hypothetical protein
LSEPQLETRLVFPLAALAHIVVQQHQQLAGLGHQGVERAAEDLAGQLIGPLDIIECRLEVVPLAGWPVFGKVSFARVALSGLRCRHIVTAAAASSAGNESLLRRCRNAQPLLHQYQRPSRPGPTGERDYLEATFDDIERANQLASKVLGRTLDSLMAQTRQLLVLLDDYVGQRCQREAKLRLELRFTQREIREALGWGDFQLRRHLRRLVELEYVLVHRTKRGNQREYELLYDGQGRDGEPFVLGLIDVAKLRRAQYDNRNDKYDNRNDRLSEGNDVHPMPLRWAQETTQAPMATGS